MRRLQGSEATCCTTRLTDTSSTAATNCAAPALGADELFRYATPSLLVMVCDAEEPPTERLNFTGVGSRMRLWNLSKMKATPLTELGRFTGTREGRAEKLMIPGLSGLSKKTCDCGPPLPRTIATQRPALRISSPFT